MMKKKDRIIIYILLPILFVAFIIGKVKKLLFEFWKDIQDGIINCDEF